MNVTLNIPAETGTGRAVATVRRGGDNEAQPGEFGALYDEVIETPATQRGSPSDTPTEMTATPDDAEADSVRRGGGEPQNSDWSALAATPATHRGSPSDTPTEMTVTPDDADTESVRREGGKRQNSDWSALGATPETLPEEPDV